jgi:hypothetical protein
VAQPSALGRLVERGVLDGELAALLSVLAELGVPLVVAGRERAAAELVRGALVEAAGAARAAGAPAGPSGGATGGVLVADSLAEVVRLAGARLASEVPDELRDLGLLVVVRAGTTGPRVEAAHYIRPLERDAGGHVQRRRPAVLAAWDERSGRWEHFAWGITTELAERAGLTVVELERALADRAASL